MANRKHQLCSLKNLNNDLDDLESDFNTFFSLDDTDYNTDFIRILNLLTSI